MTTYNEISAYIARMLQQGREDEAREEIGIYCAEVGCACDAEAEFLEDAILDQAHQLVEMCRAD